MLKLALTAVVTATVCFAIGAAVGTGASIKVLNLKVGGIISFKSDNFHCQALTKTQVACGANSLPNSVQVFYAPHQLAVVKFDKTGKKGAVVYGAKR